MVNLDAHVRILKTLGLAPVVAVNRFASDMDREIDAIVDHCKDLGVRAAAHTCHEDGGAGGETLARLLLDATAGGAKVGRLVYKEADPFEGKVRTVAPAHSGG